MLYTRIDVSSSNIRVTVTSSQAALITPCSSLTTPRLAAGRTLSRLPLFSLGLGLRGLRGRLFKSSAPSRFCKLGCINQFEILLCRLCQSVTVRL